MIEQNKTDFLPNPTMVDDCGRLFMVNLPELPNGTIFIYRYLLVFTHFFFFFTGATISAHCTSSSDSSAPLVCRSTKRRTQRMSFAMPGDIVVRRRMVGVYAFFRMHKPNPTSRSAKATLPPMPLLSEQAKSNTRQQQASSKRQGCTSAKCDCTSSTIAQ